ncbi:MAG: hypothetical protein ACK5M4_05755 [Pseudorhodobacter sp.]
MIGKRLKTLWTDECGAVTVDWVVLTAAIVGLSMLFLIPFFYSTDSTTQRIADRISSIPVGEE